MLDNQEENTHIQVKNLSKDIEHWTYNQTLSLCKIFINKTMIPALFDKGRQEDKSIEEIRKDLEEIVPYRTMMRYAPEWSKGPQKPGPRNKLPVGNLFKQSNNATLVLDKEPEIPAPPQPIIEHIPEEPQPISTVTLKPLPKRQKIKIEIPFGYVVRLSKEAAEYRTKATYSIEYDTDIKQITDLFIDKK
jgi:hypothetical protein